MLKMRIIPCLDVKDGRVVKGVNFVDLVDAGDPVEQATLYDAAGADELASSTSPPATRIATRSTTWWRRTAEACFMPLTVGGGVRTVEDIRKLLLAGADKVSINTAAVTRPRLRRARPPRSSAPVHRGRDRRQARSRPAALGNLHPWRPHADRHRRGRLARERMAALGAGEILLTSMDRDGTKQGYDLALTRAIADAVRVPVIASGGVGTLDHLVEGIRDGHATAVLAASIFHFGESTIGQAKAHMAAAGLPMRLDP